MRCAVSPNRKKESGSEALDFSFRFFAGLKPGASTK